MKYTYADYNATTPAPAGHMRQLMQQMDRAIANPSSQHHLGRESKLLLENAREHVAGLFGCERSRLIFSSGATESNNLVVQGVVQERFAREGRKVKVLLTKAEHASVYQVAEAMQRRGLCELIYAPVLASGIVDSNALLALLNKDVHLVCLIHVNNETGAINPLESLTESIRHKAPHVHIHVDAVQSYGKIDVQWIGSSVIDSASASGHKIGALKGIGCLYLKKGAKLPPLIYGGGQEKSWRAGTENLAGILSFGLRAQDLKQKTNWLPHIEALRTKLISGLLQIAEAQVHGDPALCLATTLNFHVESLSSEDLLLAFDAARIAVSSGSACASGSGRPSHVLKAMGYSDDIASRSIRISFGESSKSEDVDLILKTLLDLVRWKKRSS